MKIPKGRDRAKTASDTGSAVVVLALVWTIYSVRPHTHQATGESQS